VTPDLRVGGLHARRLKLDTLVRLRWLAVAGQATAVAIVKFALEYRLPFLACIAVIGCAALVNVAIGLRWPASHRLGDGDGVAILAFDIVQLAALLYLTGGLQNPFAILFLAPVLISATTLSPQGTLLLGTLAVGCATGLAFGHRELPWGSGGPLHLPAVYVAGIWTAVVLGIAFTGLFAWRVAEEARQLADALAATELVLAREQHLSQLDGLAAAAAHELGTPLATITLVARELDRQAEPGSALAEDTRLLREQAERCRVILSKLTSLGDEDGGFLERMTIGHLIEELVDPQRAFDVTLDVTLDGAKPEPVLRRSPGLIYGLGNLLDNAVDFARSRVVVAAAWSDEEVSVTIRDDGPGFAPEILLRVGEPYVTSRGRGQADPGGEAGSGLGLGLFIAKTLIERSGGELAFANAPHGEGGAFARIVWRRTDFEAGATAQASATPSPLSEPEIATI
jgi:two-component system sensor histidine kinase RegB